MDMGFILIASCGTVAATLITGLRVCSINTVAKYATLIDVAFTVAMLALFAGTLTGMLVAIVSGLLMALTLTAIKLGMGYHTVRFKTPSFTWLKATRLQWPVKQHPDWAAGNF